MRAARTATILFFLFSQYVAAQQVGAPFGLNYRIYKSIPEKSFQAIDTASISARLRQQSSPKMIQETVGYNFKPNFSPDKDGSWRTISSDFDSWFLKLNSEGAYGLALVITSIELMTGETLYIYNQKSIRGPYTNDNIPRSGILPLDFFPGDEIMIEYNVPLGNNRHGRFVVETVSHAFRNIFGNNIHSSKETQARTSSDCYVCLNDDAIEKERRSVVKLVILYDSISKFCTGTLMNNTAHDNKPYVLTAEHCVSDQFDADRTIAVFGFEDIDCVGGQTHYDDFTLSGAYHRASLFENDFSILEFYNKPPLEFHPYYAGWDVSDKYLNGVTSVHHPQGGPKKVSVSNSTIITSNFEDGNPRSPNAFWNVTRWDVGVTEGGSSGASLFNKDNVVIGTLAGGSSACGEPYNDYFEKLSTSWEASPEANHQLKYWLDPVGSGVKKLNGNNPFEGINAACNAVSNVKPGEQLNLLPYINGDGYFSGYNADGIASYAEKFSTVDSVMLTDVTLNVANINTESNGGLIINVYTSDGGIPGTSLSESYVPYASLKVGAFNYIDFYPYIKLAGDFFVGYTLSYSSGDSFALGQVDWRNDSENTAFVKLGTGWEPMNSISPNGKGSSLGIKIMLCKDTLIKPSDEEATVRFYPNPSTEVLIGKLPSNSNEEYHLEVFDLQGRQQPVLYDMYENNVVITTTDLRPGLYLVRLTTLHGVYRSKFIKL